jgi:hypothetical protein
MLLFENDGALPAAMRDEKPVKNFAADLRSASIGMCDVIDAATAGEDKRLFGSYPIRKVTTPVPVEGGMAGSALPMGPGTSFQGRRKPTDRRATASPWQGPGEEAKHAMIEVSLLKC